MPGAAGQLSTNVRPLSISVGLSSFSVNLSTISVGPSSISVGISSISVGSLSISFTLLSISVALSSISVRLLCISVRLWNTSVSFQLSVLGFQLSVSFYDDNSGMRKAFFIWVLGNQNCHQCNDNSCLSVHEDIQHGDAGETSGRKAQVETEGHSEVRELHVLYRFLRKYTYLLTVGNEAVCGGNEVLDSVSILAVRQMVEQVAQLVAQTT